MFDIKTDKFGEFVQYSLINNQSGEYVSVIPGFGANITKMVFKAKGTLLSVIKGYENPDDLVEQKGYRSTRLMPFPNRVDQGLYTFEELPYQLDINRPKEGHAIHGLFYNKTFKVDRFTAGPNNAKLDLYLDYDGNITSYPFALRIELALILSVGGFRSLIKVINTGAGNLPFGDGWHPYFALDGSVDDWLLKVPAADLLELNDHKIPTGKSRNFDLFTNREKIADMNLDVALHLHDHSIAITELYEKSNDVTLSLWQETGPNNYNFLQIYTPASRDSIALEPMTCAPDAFNNKLGLIILEPGESFETSFGVSLR